MSLLSTEVQKERIAKVQTKQTVTGGAVPVRACVRASLRTPRSWSLHRRAAPRRAAPLHSIPTPWRVLQRAVRGPPGPGAGGAAGRAAAAPERRDAAPDQSHHQPLLKAATRSVVGLSGGDAPVAADVDVCGVTAIPAASSGQAERRDRDVMSQTVAGGALRAES